MRVEEGKPPQNQSWLWAVWPDWAIYSTLGNFLKPLATINLPKSTTFLGLIVKGSKSIIFLVKSFLGNFYSHLVIFFLVTLVSNKPHKPQNFFSHFGKKTCFCWCYRKTKKNKIVKQKHTRRYQHAKVKQLKLVNFTIVTYLKAFWFIKSYLYTQVQDYAPKLHIALKMAHSCCFN